MTVMGRTLAENLEHAHKAILSAVRPVVRVDALPDAELAGRARSWMPRATDDWSDANWKHAQTVGPGRDAAVAHPGGAKETHCYADI